MKTKNKEIKACKHELRLIKEGSKGGSTRMGATPDRFYCIHCGEKIYK